MGGAAIASAVVATQLITRFGTRPVQTAAGLLSVAGLLLLSRADATGSYATQIVPGTVLFGIGIIAVSVPAQITAVAEARHDDAGAASGVFTAFQQVGGAIGLAVVTTLANSRTAHELASGASQSDALVAGFQRGLLVAAVFAAGTFAVSLLSPRIEPTAEQMAGAAAAA
jgi:hypothetical protein